MRWLLVVLLGGCCESSIGYSGAPGPDGEGCLELQVEGAPAMPSVWYPIGTSAKVFDCEHESPHGYRSYTSRAGSSTSKAISARAAWT